ncbi:hypothetical protein ACN4EB_06245 [Corynebacterium macclintockiae]|uniref:hypothetical protein n=1 Tax=Corynebacterium macclintockiae TaxID=2913501 RepID=UPI003EBF6570
MEFTQSPPKEFGFNKSLSEYISQTGNHFQTEIGKFSPDEPENQFSHTGNFTFEGTERLISFTERDGEVLEFIISTISKEDTFMDAPLAMGAEDFCDFITQQSIPWEVSWDNVLFLYDNWMSFYIEDSLLRSILWYNPEVMPYLELLDMAFPPKTK